MNDQTDTTQPATVLADLRRFIGGQKWLSPSSPLLQPAIDLIEQQEKTIAQYEKSWESYGMDMHPAYVESFNRQKRLKEEAEAKVEQQAAEIERWKKAHLEAVNLATKYAAEKGEAEGKLLAIGWQGGVEKTVEGFRQEIERLRHDLRFAEIGNERLNRRVRELENENEK